MASLEQFIQFLYGNETGFVCAAYKSGSSMLTQYFEYPNERANLAEYLHRVGKTYNVYMTPALLKEAGSLKKDNFSKSRVAWVDLDAGNKAPGAHALVTTSNNRAHAYFRLNETVTSASVLEGINSTLVSSLEGDPSGIDATQLLRPPETLNFKYEEPQTVSLRKLSFKTTGRLVVADFGTLVAQGASPSNRSLQTITWRATFEALEERLSPRFRTALGQPADNRSEWLYTLGLQLHREQAVETPDEYISVLIAADVSHPRGPKYATSGVVTEYERIYEKTKPGNQSLTVVGTRQVKLPGTITRGGSNEPEAIANVRNKFIWLSDFDTYNLPSLQRVYGDFLHEGTVSIIAGPGGHGKSSFALKTAQSLCAMGINQRDPYGVVVATPMSNLFVSIEMNEFGFSNMRRRLIPPSKPFGPVPTIPGGTPPPRIAVTFLDVTPTFYDDLEMIIAEAVEKGVKGVWIDSLSATIGGGKSLVSDEHAMEVMRWSRKIVDTYGCFLVWIAHARKGDGGIRSIDDLFGSVYFATQSDLVVAAQRVKGNFTLRVFKGRYVRFSEKMEVFQHTYEEYVGSMWGEEGSGNDRTNRTGFTGTPGRDKGSPARSDRHRNTVHK